MASGYKVEGNEQNDGFSPGRNRCVEAIFWAIFLRLQQIETV
jgi:hypothetical protein